MNVERSIARQLEQRMNFDEFQHPEPLQEDVVYSIARKLRVMWSYNPQHVPAGSPEGGQFAPAAGGSGTVPDLGAKLEYGEQSVGIDFKDMTKEVDGLTKEVDELATRQTWTEHEIRLLTGDSYDPHYEIVTGYLRDDRPDPTPKMEEAVATIDAKFDDAEGLKDDLVVWRGWRAEQYFERGESETRLVTPKTDFKVGDEYVDKAYTMTTLSPKLALAATADPVKVHGPIANRIARMGPEGKLDWDPKRLVFRITMPAGSKVVVPPTKAASQISGRNVNNREAIVLLPRNTKFSVTRVWEPTEATAHTKVIDLRPI